MLRGDNFNHKIKVKKRFNQDENKKRNLIYNNNRHSMKKMIGYSTDYLKHIITSKFFLLNTTNSNTSMSKSGTNHTLLASEYYDFEFAYDVGILALSNDIISSHNFEIINVTFSGSQCFGNGGLCKNMSVNIYAYVSYLNILINL
jgi:hypothetical protein